MDEKSSPRFVSAGPFDQELQLSRSRTVVVRLSSCVPLTLISLERRHGKILSPKPPIHVEAGSGLIWLGCQARSPLSPTGCEFKATYAIDGLSPGVGPVQLAIRCRVPAVGSAIVSGLLSRGGAPATEERWMAGFRAWVSKVTQDWITHVTISVEPWDLETNTDSSDSDQLRSSAGSLDRPIIAFVNSKSGGRQGIEILKELRTILPPAQIFDLSEGGPEPGLELFKKHLDLKVVACGGDGTGRWILETIDKMDYQGFHKPAVGVLPLGTGNDIARVLGWGGGYEGESLSEIVGALELSDEVLFDRWCVTITPSHGPLRPSDFFKIEPNSSGDYSTDSDSESDVNDSHLNDDRTVRAATTSTMNNYLSIGFADAAIALAFHEKREQSPGLFFSRGINKMFYGALGLQNMIDDLLATGPGRVAEDTGSRVFKLAEVIEIAVDGEIVELPFDLDGVIVINIPTYSGGMNLWGKEFERKFSTPSFDDGKLEVCGIRGTGHLVQIGMNTASAVRLAQGARVEIKFTPGPPLPGKIDGEPWLQTDACSFSISSAGKCSMLARHGSCGARSAANTQEPYFSGWLTKQGEQVKSWKVRFCVLKDGVMQYFASRQATSRLGEIDVRNSIVAPGKNPSLFELRTEHGAGRSYIIDCERTKEDREAWIAACIEAGATRGT